MSRTESKNTILARLFGDYPLIKILDFFLTYRDFDYSKTQVAKETGISRITLEKIWKGLGKKKIIVKTRNVGRASLFKLNLENPLVKLLVLFDLQLSDVYSQIESSKKPLDEISISFKSTVPA